jgi:sortase A
MQARRTSSPAGLQERKELIMNAKPVKTWGRWLLAKLGLVLTLAGLVCIALLFVGPPGNTAGSVPTKSGLAPPPTTEALTGPADKTMYLTVPKIGLEDVKVHDSLSEEKLEESAVHVPETGFPWQPGANTYIAGHRLGFFGTPSFLVFFRLNELESGDEIILKDSIGNEYVYRVTGATVVTPEDIELLNPVVGRSIVSLQTCTLPDFSERLVVQGELQI